MVGLFLLPDIGTPIAIGIAWEHWTKPHVLAKFRALTLSYVYIFKL